MSLKQEKTENKNELKLTITVEASKFDNAIMDVFKKNAKYFNIPGFRKGKAPFKIVERYYGDDIFYEDAFKEIFPESYEEEIRANKIDVVSKPIIDVVQIEKGKDLIFTAVVSTKPDFELGKYKGIELKKIEKKVTDKDVDDEINKMADKNARMITVEDRPAQKDDIVTIDFEGFVDDVPFEGGKAEGQQLTIGSNTYIPGFEDQIIGMKINEERDINVTFPKDYPEKTLAGKDARFHIVLHSISAKEMPKIDDEFAKDVSEFDTLAELKKSIKDKKEKENEEEIKTEMEDNAIDEVIKNTKIDVSDGMIELETDNMEDSLNERLQYQGLNLDTYLQFMGKTKEQFRNEYKDEAIKNIKTRLILEKIAETEKLKPDEKHIKEQIEKMAKQYGRKVEDIEKNENVKDYLTKGSLNEQAVDFIVKNAKITK